MKSDPAMKGVNWKRVEELYHEALSKSRAERARFLESACQGDADLRREVESLLASLDKDGALLEVRALEVAARMLAEARTPSMQGPPQSPSSMLHPQGRGGTGEVPKAGAILKWTRKIFHYAPWWMYLLAAVFAADCLLRAYCYILGPGGLGPELRRNEKKQYVFGDPSPAAERAGIRPGDVLLSIDGLALQGPADLTVIRANSEVGGRYNLEIERDVKRLQFTVQVERRRVFQNWGSQVNALWQINGLLLLATALLVAFARPFNLLARTGALALGTLSVGLYITHPPPGYAAFWRNLPPGLGTLLWIPNICIYLVGPIVLTFFVLFPRPLFRARWPWVFIWLPALGFVPACARNTFLLLYRSPQVYGNLFSVSLIPLGGRVLGLYGLASLAALAANYFRLTDPNDRRRLRVLFFGGGAAILPGALRMAVWQFPPLSAVHSWLASGVPDVLVALIFALFPVCFAYSILRHRLLDIRVIIRQGLQYAAARGALLSVVPLLGVILVADLLVHGDQPLIGILEMRGWIYAAVAAAAVAVHSQRRRWGESIDRRFFREQYDARRLLHAVAAEAGQARSFAHAAPGVVARIEAALHPEFVAIMHRQSGETTFRTLISSPSDKAPPAILGDTNLIHVMRVLGGPLEVSLGGSSWLQRQLPDIEIAFVRQARIDLLVPITLSPETPEQKEALIVLGAKRSEEPYTREDQELLEAIAANLARPFDQEALAARHTSGTFDECPQCGTCSDSGLGRCAVDGADLTPVPLSRTLGGRYQLERRRGRGGMGTVYEAKDKALGRRVAVKVIREDFVYSAAAARRFEREARAGAAFGHPNVVTVYDYGVEAGRRAYLVMELLDGATLRDQLKSHGRLPAARMAEIFRPVCSAVDAAQRHQLIHRDLKPENIFLVRNGDTETETVKVLDFGVAKFLDASEAVAESQNYAVTESGVLVGTLGYMSPEQLLGEKAAISWDVWALAVTAYETLTGALPFPVDDRVTWRQSVLAGSYTPLSEYLKDPPASWREFFARSLAVDRERRPRSAAEFLHQLEQAFA
jgi:tRNA A-37 threonylcarbamoyl transferase component Bud32